MMHSNFPEPSSPVIEMIPEMKTPLTLNNSAYLKTAAFLDMAHSNIAGQTFT